MKVPRHLTHTIGKPRVTNDTDEYVAFTVQVNNATYLGFPVTSLTRWAGKENGINGFSIAVDGAPATVETKAKSTLNIREELSECGGVFGMQFDALKDGKTSISCDTSC